MRYIITAIRMSKRTRRRMGKAFTQQIDSQLDVKAVEKVFQDTWNTIEDTDVKVIDVRELTALDKPNRRAIEREEQHEADKYK